MKIFIEKKIDAGGRFITTDSEESFNVLLNIAHSTGAMDDEALDVVYFRDGYKCLVIIDEGGMSKQWWDALRVARVSGFKMITVDTRHRSFKSAIMKMGYTLFSHSQ
jgi:hypothetical protein